MISLFRQLHVKTLLNIDAIDYLFINEDIAHIACKKLKLKFVFLLKFRSLKGFDGKSTTFIIHVIYFFLIVQNHRKALTLMLITKLNNHHLILSKFWMNVHDILLNMQSNRLIFELDHYSHFDVFKTFMSFLKNSFDLRFILNSVFIEFVNSSDRFTSFTQDSNQFKKSILKKTLNFKSNNSFIFSFNVVTKKSISFKSSNKLKTSTNIVMIDVVVFYKLNFRKNKTANVKYYFMIMFKIDDALTIYRVKNDLKISSIEINEMDEIFIKKSSLKEIKIKFHLDFHDLLQTFDLITTENLSLHRFYNYKIDFIDDFHMMRNRIYSLSYLKLMKLKKYLKKNLKKNFINFNNVSFFSSILFVIKFNEKLRFCVNYCKFNVIIKRNDYLILLIDETLIKFIEYKYIIKLNIIATFNKLRIHSKNENLITFICSLKAYKYHVFFFNLTNGFFNYQHYMNDILFDFFNEFVQCYLNDIFIYNKIKKEHICHVRLILQKLIDASLQVDILKSCFYVQEITFLKIIIFIKGIRMNFKKMKIIVNWQSSTNFKEIQKFINFCNFYWRFIKKFSKIVRLMLKLI